MKFCTLCARKFEDKSAFCPFDGEGLAMVLDAEDMVGRLIDNKYSIETHIARGGTGTVYRALHIQLNVPVAVKILHNDRTNDATAVERFRREAYAAMQVRHPNAIGVFDFGVTSDNLVYVVMELLDGMSLRQRLKQQCYLSLIDINNIMQQICAAVAVAHKHKIVHRDLKPENVFLHDDNGEEVVRVLDFGLAKLRGLSDEGESLSITRAGLVIGTPLYMSPEQSRGRPVDRRSDIYSLGIMFYELLTGQLPFRGSSLSALAIKHATEAPRPIYEIRPNLPHLVNAAVMHALEKSPQKRPATVTAWAAEIQAAVTAVSENEFRDLFLTAGDQDLEAALLLAMDPGKQAFTSDAMAGGLSGNLNSNLTGDLLEIAAPVREMTGPLTGALAFHHANLLNTVTQDLDDLPPGQLKNLNFTIADEDGYQGADAEQLDEQLLNVAQETAVLLQIVIGDLTARIKLDQVFFDELTAAIERLREKMAQIRKLYHS